MDYYNDLILKIRSELSANPDCVTEVIVNFIRDAIKQLQFECEELKIKFEMFLAEEAQKYNNTVGIYLFTAALAIRNSHVVFERFLEFIVYESKIQSINVMTYLYMQCNNYAFRSPCLNTIKTKEMLWILEEEIVNRYAVLLKKSIEYIPNYKRVKGMVFVLTDQFISIEHGPTKTALDRCYILSKTLGKKVVLINTSECLSQVGKIPIYNSFIASYDENLSQKDFIEWKSVRIPYFQFGRDTPSLETITTILNLVKSSKPEYIVSIGGNCITTNILSKMLPVISIGLCPSMLTTTSATCQTVSYKLSNKELEMINRLGKSNYHIIESIFSFSIIEQKMIIHREDMGFCEDEFLCAVVGARLSVDITDDFLDMLESVDDDRIKFVLMGSFSKEQDYKRIIESRPLLNKSIKYIGFVDDTVGHLSMCDLYVNPDRIGGGTSAVEAMSRGVPVVTIGRGDVAINTGDEFWVTNYEEMRDRIIEYKKDKEFYATMKQKALERADMLLNSENEFSRVINRFESIIIEKGL